MFSVNLCGQIVLTSVNISHTFLLARHLQMDVQLFVQLVLVAIVNGP